MTFNELLSYEYGLYLATKEVLSGISEKMEFRALNFVFLGLFLLNASFVKCDEYVEAADDHEGL